MSIHPYFSTLFKKETGQTYISYITRLKMDKARELLAANCKVYETAHLLGYEDIRHFRNTFKKYHGVSPLRSQTSAGRTRPLILLRESLSLLLQKQEKIKYTTKNPGICIPDFYVYSCCPYILGRLLVPLGPFFSHFTSRTVPVSLTRTTGTYITRLFLFSS